MPEHIPDCPCCAHSSSTGFPRATITRRDVLRWGAGTSAAAIVAAGIPFAGGAAFRRQALGSAFKDPSWPAPPIVTRKQWGADESLRSEGIDFTDVVEKLIVHHTVTPNNPSDPAAVVRSVYQYHTSGVYWDIAYNWLIDHEGRIYQGRWAGKNDIVGERNGKQVVGGHTGGFNSRSIGIAFLGTHTTSAPTTAALEALRTLLTWKCARWGIDPTGATPYERADGVDVTVPNIMGHRDAKPTTCPGDPVLNLLPSVRRDVKARLTDTVSTGYYVSDAVGSVHAFGEVPDLGDPRRSGTVGNFAGMAAHPSGKGYWVAGRLGGVFQYGAAAWHGSMYGRPLSSEIVDIAATRSGDGYWLLGRDGSVYAFGDAPYLGSTRDTQLQAPVNRIVTLPTAPGYWILAEDGGVFTFGDAQFYGSMGATSLNSKVIGMAAHPNGRGYWLLGGDGGVFSFGDAAFSGSTGDRSLAAPVVDILASRTGRGYMLLGRDGGVFTFGDADFRGSAAGRTNSALRIAGVI